MEQGFEYLVISDHSKSAFYANGLSEERIREQHAYIDELNRNWRPSVFLKVLNVISSMMDGWITVTRYFPRLIL